MTKRPISKAFIILSLFAILLLGFSTSGFSTIYYVNTAADAGGDGTTQELTGEHCAFKTIAQVNAASPAAGSSILFNKGNEWREQLTVPTSGSDGSPITFGAYGEGADPIINGADIIETWTEVADWVTTWTGATQSSNTSGATTRGKRQILANANLSQNGIAVRVTIQANGVAQTDIDGASIGQRDGTSDDYISDGFTRITFDTGNNYCNIAAGEDKVSDEIDITGWPGGIFDSTKDHLMHLQWNDAYQYPYENSAGLQYSDENAGDNTMVQAPGMGGPYTYTTGLKLVEVYQVITNVWQAACTTEPNQVFFDGTKGTAVASAALCNGVGKWFWEANVLYVYYEEDPDGAVSIEASVRDRCVDINSNDYITLDGLHFKYGNSSQVLVTGTAFIMDDCVSEYADNSGVSFWGAYTTITSGTIKNSTFNNNGENGIFVGYSSNGPNNIIIENNDIHDNGTTASLDHGIYLDYTTSSIVRYNKIYDNSVGNGLQLQDASDNNEVYCNLIYGNGMSGIWLGTGDGADDNTIYNNTIYGNGNGHGGIQIGATSSGNLIKNNIIHQVDATYAMCVEFADETSAQAQTLDYNCYYYPGAETPGDVVYIAGITTYYSLAEWQAYTGSPDAHSFNSDPLMIDPANGDFHLNPHSPCVNAGTSVSLTEDYEGLKIRHAPDIGAYENQANVLFFSWFLRDFLGVNK